jgi:hypothetical protein
MGSNNTHPHLNSGPNFFDAFRAIGDVSRDQSVFLPGEGIRFWDAALDHGRRAFNSIAKVVKVSAADEMKENCNLLQ